MKHFDLIQQGVISYGDPVHIDQVAPSMVVISWHRDRDNYQASIDIQLLAALVNAWQAENGSIGAYLQPTAQVVTKESHPEVWAKLQPPKVPLATLDAWDHAGRRPGEGSANPAP